MSTFTPSPELYPFESRWFDSSRGRVRASVRRNLFVEPFVPSGMNRKLTAAEPSAFPQAHVVELPGARHYFVEDAPDEVADAVVAHFRGRP